MTISWVVLHYIYTYIYLAIYIPILLFNNTTWMTQLKITWRPHPSVSLSVCLSVSETNTCDLFSWNSVLQFCTKGYQASERFEKSDSVPAVLYGKHWMNFYLRIPYLLIDLCELGAENLQIMPLCKYQINQARSSGSHSVIQDEIEKINYLLLFSKFCPLSK
jgi:hypothetical protein